MNDSLIYLDHHATTPLSPEVFEAMRPWMDGRYVGNPHAGSSRAGREAQDAIQKAREQVAAIAGVDSEHVIFTSGATEAVNIILRSLITSDTHLIISNIEHSCVSETAKDLQEKGARLSIIEVDEDGLINPTDIEELMDDEESILSIMGVNNEIGTIQPLKDIADIVHDSNGIIHSDVAQAAGRIPINLDDIGVDIISFSSHKIYGPQGIGAIAGRSSIMKRLKPLMTGGGQEKTLRPGTLPVASCVGFGVACDLSLRFMEKDNLHAAQISTAFLERLRQSYPDISINGNMEKRVKQNLNLHIPGCDGDDLTRRLVKTAISTGSACADGSLGASDILLAIGLSEKEADESIRIGFGRHNTLKEVLEAADEMTYIIKEIRG